MADTKEMKLTIRRRFEFIEFQLTWEGWIGRKKLQDQFSISMQQATNDLSAYLDFCPENMVYNPRQKAYIPSKNFQPHFTSGKSAEYFMHLEILHKGYRQCSEIWASEIPKFDAVSTHVRNVKSRTLIIALDAIRSDGCLSAEYFSLASENHEKRTLKPHAIATDGHRWHVRAFDFEKERYSDFVLSRLRSTRTAEAPQAEIPIDSVWETEVDLILTADPEMSDAQRSSLEYEYGMEDGCLHLKIRQAMLFYYLRNYGFNPLEKENNKIRNNSSFHLKISNLDEVEECLGRRG